jgi:hypothetical protein
MLYSEILDGFGSDWGFSPGDLLFNTLGVAFATGQETVPLLQAFEVRVSYWPSGATHGRPVIEDYPGQTYWLTANLHRLSGGEPSWLPPWLGATVGYAARDPDELHMLQTSVVLVGLDIDVGGIPINHPAWRTFAGIMRYIRVPAPAVRLTQGVRFLPFAF